MPLLPCVPPRFAQRRAPAVRLSTARPKLRCAFSLASVSEPGRSASTSYATARVYGVLVYWASHFCSAHLVFIRYYIDRYYQRTAWHSGCPRSTIPERERAARFSVPFLSPPYMWALLSLVKLADALLTSRLGGVNGRAFKMGSEMHSYTFKGARDANATPGWPLWHPVSIWPRVTSAKNTTCVPLPRPTDGARRCHS